MKTYSLKKTIRNNPILWLLIFGIWLFYLWIIYETPYEIDDWSWGLPEGWQALLTGEWNGRYLSNLLEVTVSRSLLLKTLLIGTFAALLPVLSAQLCMRFLDDEKAYGVEAKHREKATPLFLLAVMLYLTLPIPVWAQTYGWIAGFSNFGFAGIILLIYQVILLRVLQSDRQNSKLLYAVVFLFGIGMQLVLENTTIYALAVTAFFLLEEAIKKRKENVRLFVWMLVGNMIGTVMMFKGSIYGTLMETGLAVNGMRAITIDQSKSLVENLLLCQQRFAIDIHAQYYIFFRFKLQCFLELRFTAGDRQVAVAAAQLVQEFLRFGLVLQHDPVRQLVQRAHVGGLYFVQFAAVRIF